MRIPKAVDAVAATALLAVLFALPQFGAGAQQTSDAEQINLKIREEGWENSQVMRTLHFLTDRYGPRLTGSPNHENAAKWAVRQMEEWGFANAHLEPFDFGRPGWLNERFAVHMIAPIKDPLVGEVLAWTPSTPGPVTAQVFHLLPPESPTEAELAAFFESARADVAGKIVLVGEHQELGVSFQTPSKRRDDEQLRQQYDPDRPQQAGRGGRRGGGRGGAQQPDPDVLSAREVAARIDRFLIGNGAVVRLNDGARQHRRRRPSSATRISAASPASSNMATMSCWRWRF